MKNNLSFLKNRYILTGLVFLVWMGFLDRDDLISHINLNNKLADISKQRESYKSEIEKVRSNLIEIQSHPQKLEKLAREKYYMKKDNEDLYVLVDDIKKKSSPEVSIFNKIRSIFGFPILKPIKK